MNMSDVGRFCAHGFIMTSLLASAGYVVGTLSGKDPVLAAKAAAISSLVIYFFSYSVEFGTDLRNEAKNVVYIVATTVGGAALISALKNYELISTIGMAILGTGLFVANTIAIVGHFNGIQVYSG